jgi:hypothetical protein
MRFSSSLCLLWTNIVLNPLFWNIIVSLPPLMWKCKFHAPVKNNKHILVLVNIFMNAILISNHRSHMFEICRNESCSSIILLMTIMFTEWRLTHAFTQVCSETTKFLIKLIVSTRHFNAFNWNCEQDFSTLWLTDNTRKKTPPQFCCRTPNKVSLSQVVYI